MPLLPVERVPLKKKTGRKGKETEHLKALRIACAQYSCYGYKIPDLPFKLQSPKPFDMFLSIFGVSVAAEGKYTTEKGRFGWYDLSENQRNGLIEHQRSGGVSVAVLFQHVPGVVPKMFWFTIDELATEKRFECDSGYRPCLKGERVAVLKKSALGKERKEYSWRYDAWPFLHFCTEEYVRLVRLAVKHSPGSGAALTIGRYLLSDSLGPLGPHRPTE